MPTFFYDIVRFFLAISPVAAIGCLVNAGLSMRHEGLSFPFGRGSFGKNIFWAVVFLTLRPTLLLFSAWGVGGGIPSGGATTTPWLASIGLALYSFVLDFVVGRLVPVFAAMFVLRAVIDLAEGGSPLPSVLGALFLLTVVGTRDLLASAVNPGDRYALATVLESAWTHLQSSVMPSAAGLALIGAVTNYARQRPWGHLAVSALALLCVSGLWKLIQAMVA